MTISITTTEHLKEQELALAELITVMHFQHHPPHDLVYGKGEREKWKQDAVMHLSSLADAMSLNSPELFIDYLEWTHGMLQSRHLPVADLVNHLQYINRACQHFLPSADCRIITQYITKGMQCLKDIQPLPKTFLTTENPLQSYAKDYLNLLLKGSRKPAQSLLIDLLEKQHGQVAAVYEQVLKVTQYEVGLLWQTNKITLAQEHFCTAATTMNMEALHAYSPLPPSKGLKMLGCTMPGDLHEVGIRMLVAFFKLNGWDTGYTGTNMPNFSIIAAAKEQRANLLAISVTLPGYISKAEKLIQKIRDDKELADLRIIVGGYPFNMIPGLWNRIGAHGSAANAAEAIALANRLVVPQSSFSEVTF